MTSTPPASGTSLKRGFGITFKRYSRKSFYRSAGCIFFAFFYTRRLPSVILPVVRAFPVLAEIMFVQQRLLHFAAVPVYDHGVPVHKGHLFHNDGVVHRVHGVRPPGKRPVAVYQYAGDGAGSSVRKVSMITFPVSFSYSPLISASVIGRVQGIAPWK